MHVSMYIYMSVLCQYREGARRAVGVCQPNPIARRHSPLESARITIPLSGVPASGAATHKLQRVLTSQRMNR